MARILFSGGLAFALTIASSLLSAQEVGGFPSAVFQQVSMRGIEFLRKVQNPDGSFSSELGPGVTSLATTALLRHGIPPKDPVIANALNYIESFEQPDGGLYQENSLYRNYETCLALVCLAEVKNARYDRIIKRAQDFVKGIQWDESEGIDPSSTSYGGAGYGKHRRPDLSNTAFFVEALKATGLTEEDDAMQRALAFVSKCQNLESQYNTTPFSTKNPDGGFYYTSAAGGSSQAGETSTGGLRSYGSMTYAGLKSMIYAGLEPDDPRVMAANDWISRYYSLQENPGLKDAGLYYYYHTFAKALDAMGQDSIKDAEGNQHQWRTELLHVLADRQQSNGSWVNTNDRWLEGDAELVTAYALLAISYCK